MTFKQMKQKGFTLIELMIVVAIIGILAAVAIPAYSDYIAKSKVSECNMSFAGFKTEATVFYADVGSFPTQLESMDGIVTTGNYIDSIAYNGDQANPLYSCKLKGFEASKDTVAWLYANLGTADAPKMQWVCRGAGDPNNGGATTLADKYLPKACKDNS